jgi:hypothetical protein
MSEDLKALAARAEDEPFFLAALLAAYAHSEGLDDAGLAAALGCPVGELNMVRLCRAPRPGFAEFREDVVRIADRFGLDPLRLAEAVKRGRVVTALRSAEAATEGFLMAARDREDPPERAKGS